MCGDQTFRIIIKQVTGVPTIPVSTDHRNGDWLPTDIYEGEQAMDVNTGIVYTRSATGIEVVGGGAGSVQPRIYKAQISQAGTNAPTLVELINTLGVTPTPAYIGVGAYSLTGLTGLITGLTEVSITVPNDGVISAFAGGTISTNIVSISTFSSGVASNNVLNNDPAISKFGTSVITIIKYD